MLKLKVQMGPEGFDNITQKFVEPETYTLELEHSLASLSKWEAKYEKPFLTDKEKTAEETLGYIKAMVLNDDVPDEVWSNLSMHNLQDINDYINAKMTATWFAEKKPIGPNRETITAELIYYWLVALQIPFETQYWHLGKLMTLIKVCNAKNEPPKKMNRRELNQRHREINERRRREQAAAKAEGSPK